MSIPSRIAFAESLSLGFRQTVRAPGVILLAFGAELAAVLLSLGQSFLLAAFALDAAEVAVGSFLSGQASDRPLAGSFPWTALIGLLVVSSLLVLFLRLIWVAEGSRVFSLRVRGGQATPGLATAGGALPRALAAVALLIPLEAGALLFGATAIGAGGLAWLRSARAGSGGFLTSAALALALLLALLTTKAVDVLFRLTIVRAVGSKLRPVAALASAARLAVTRLGAFAGLLVVFGIFDALAAVAASFGGAAAMGAGGLAVGVGLALRLLGAMFGALLAAFLATAELGAYVAIDGGESGELVRPAAPPQPLPPPASPEPIVESEPILATEVVLETKPG